MSWFDNKKEVKEQFKIVKLKTYNVIVETQVGTFSGTLSPTLRKTNYTTEYRQIEPDFNGYRGDGFLTIPLDNQTVVVQSYTIKSIVFTVLEEKEYKNIYL